MFNWLETSVDKRLVPFVAILVIVAVFAFTWTVWAEEPPKAVIYRGPSGHYIPQAGEVVVMLSDGNLLVNRPGGERVYVDLITPPPAPAPIGDHFVYRNGQKVSSGSTVYADPRDQVLLRKQDESEVETLSDVNIDQRQQTEDELDGKNRRRTNNSREIRNWYETYEETKADKARAEERAKENKYDRKQETRRNIQRTLENSADRAERVGQRLGDRLGNFLQSQN